VYLGFGFLSLVDLHSKIGSLRVADIQFSVIIGEVAIVLVGEVTDEISGEPRGEVANEVTYEFPEEFSGEPATYSIGYETR